MTDLPGSEKMMELALLSMRQTITEQDHLQHGLIWAIFMLLILIRTHVSPLQLFHWVKNVNIPMGSYRSHWGLSLSANAMEAS